MVLTSSVARFQKQRSLLRGTHRESQRYQGAYRGGKKINMPFEVGPGSSYKWRETTSRKEGVKFHLSYIQLPHFFKAIYFGVFLYIASFLIGTVGAHIGNNPEDVGFGVWSCYLFWGIFHWMSLGGVSIVSESGWDHSTPGVFQTYLVRIGVIQDPPKHLRQSMAGGFWKQGGPLSL